MADATLLVSLNSDIQDRLTALAEANQRPVSEIVAEVLENFVSASSWEYRHIQQGMNELNAGSGISHDLVVQWIQQLGPDTEDPVPR